VLNSLGGEDTVAEPRTKIALLNHVGGGNLGDDATLDAVMQNIRCRWPNAEINAISMNPSDTEKRHGISSFPVRIQTWDLDHKPQTSESPFKKALKSAAAGWQPFFRLLKGINALTIRLPLILITELRFLAASCRLIRRFDLLVICGGGQLTERDGPWAFPYTLLKWVLLAKSAGVKCIFVNVGAGPLTRPLSKVFARQALAAADYVSFRDEQSQTLACQIGFTGDSRTFIDNAYSLECPSFSARCFKAGRKPVVGLAPLPYRDPRMHPAENNGAAYDEYIAKFAMLAVRLIGQSNSLVLFGTDIGVDPTAIADLQTALRKNHPDVAMPRYEAVGTTHELLSAMSAMDYVITCRFHGVVFAHMLNKPVLAISHHPKVTDLMNALGLSKYCADIRTFDPVRVADTFASLVIDTEEVKSSMAASLANYRSQLEAQFDDLFPSDPEHMRCRKRQVAEYHEEAIAGRDN
jgi:polysaccharide pyruvyl transferase WcaK-like protein